jgi:hypothetical protein
VIEFGGNMENQAKLVVAKVLKKATEIKFGT